VQLLISNGANINSQKNSGYTSLHQASERGDLKMIRLLLNYGIDKLILDKSGCTASEIAYNYEIKEFIDNYKIPIIKCPEE
jgi:ankyrin repeat protein